MRRRSVVAVTVVLAGLLLMRAAPLAAQSQATTGVIRGTVTDSIGEAVALATVTLRNVETNFQRTLTASERGVFVGTLLPLGTYEVSARRIGYRQSVERGIVLRVGQTVEVPIVLARQASELAAVAVTGRVPQIDVSRVESSTQLSDEVVSGLPNNGRNYLNLTLLTPNVALTQGPDGDELSIGGQRGIHNNVSVDGADFNNPFFGEQRGGQRPAFTFNLDAVQEVVVVSQGANAEFGRSGGGFVNVITKSGTNQLKGSLHYYGKFDALASDPKHDNVSYKPDFNQNQFGFTLGGPIVRDRAFFFVAYDQQIFTETKQTTRPGGALLTELKSYTDTAFSGALRGEFGSITRTNDANALLAKLDFRLNETNNFSLKYNYTNSKQENGTFDVDTWGRSSNALEKDFSHAVNGSLTSILSSVLSNELRFQWAREDRPRPYEGPINPATGRPFPDTGMDFGFGFRFGMPFFIPVKAYDTRIQVLDNVSWVRGDHLFKVGGEVNKTQVKQTFVGFANGRYIFDSVQGFENFRRLGNLYVECQDTVTKVRTSNTTGVCAGANTITTGPVQLYLQQAGVGGRSVEDAGTQTIDQNDIALFIQDSWKATPKLTVNYGLRWEAQIEPDPITPASQVFFKDLIGKTVTNSRGTFAFPSDGTIPSDTKMFQPRLGIAWDVSGNGLTVVRASTGLYYARIPGLNLASSRSTNGSIGQTIFRNSAATPFLGPPPAYGQLLPAPAGTPDHPDVFVFDKDFRNPRTWSSTIGFEHAITGDAATGLVGEISATYASTDFLTRFVNRNDAVFGNPFSTGIAGTNGVGVLTVVESSAKSRYSGVTLGLKHVAEASAVQYQANYTLSFDKADDDNERDPFSFRYVRPDRLDREYNWSDRDQRHRFNGWLLTKLPGAFYLNNRVSAYSAQPTSEKCGTNNQGTGQRAAAATDRICPNGTILKRNTMRRDNAFVSWDLRLSKPFEVSSRGRLEAIIEVFNVLNRDNFRDPSAVSPLFNFDGTIRSGFGDPRQVQAGVRYIF
jgi:hypothetical protein